MSTKTELKAFFETGDTPTQVQFADLIDSLGLQSETDTNTAKTGISSGQASAISANTAKVSAVSQADSTAATSELILTNPVGYYFTGTSGAAKSLTTYTTTGTTLGAYSQVLINTTSEPTVTGGTKISGSDWVTGTNMYMIVTYNGTRVEFFFLEI